MGFSDWFGGAELKARITGLENELSQARTVAVEAKRDAEEAKKRASEKGRAADEAREAKNRAEKKTEKVQSIRDV
ncbi:MAG: hypothetical protein EXR76_07410, partial [Myxococcales bacterium]|nr:hypothetical protein [Myxococcales bacterium]